MLKNHEFILKSRKFWKVPLCKLTLVFCYLHLLKNHENVFLVSTLHLDNKVSEKNDLKPQPILDHNTTKGDTFDQQVGTYTCKKKSNC